MGQKKKEVEDHLNKLNEIKDEVRKYWASCNNDCRMLSIIINASKFMFQINMFISPTENSDCEKLNIVYMIISLIVAAIQFLSFQDKYGVEFSYYAIILLLAVSALRLLDFENTKPHLDMVSWNIILMINIFENVLFIAMLGIMFANHKYNKVCLMVTICFSFVCICFGISDPKNLTQDLKKTIILIPYMLLTMIYVKYIARHFPSLIEVILQKSMLCRKFKDVFDNHDETVLFVNKKGKSVNYANYLFFREFNDDLL